VRGGGHSLPRGEGIGEALHADTRTGVVRLLPDGFKGGSSGD